jgi:NAD(P)H-dependent flavin oxidoreductase YrpB (nitropropane dioxygenase family)
MRVADAAAIRRRLLAPRRSVYLLNNQGKTGASMALPNILRDKLTLPVVGAPLFIISHPALVIAQCKAGIVGAFPALNARPISQLDEWLHVRRAALLSGAIATGRPVLAAQAMGADLPYIGSAFIATEEARAIDAYKQAIVEGDSSHIVGSSPFTGIFGNYLRPSVAKAGLDPDNLPQGDEKAMNFASRGSSEKKVWRDIWGSGQGIGAVTAVHPVADLVARLEREYAEAKTRICA